MGLKAFDGFDNYKSTTDMNARQGFLQYNSLPNPPFADLGPGRYGGNRYIVQFHWTAIFGQRVAETFIGMACLPTYSNVSSGEFHLVIGDSVGNDGQITVQFNWLNFTIQLLRGGAPTDGGDGVVIATSANNAWAGGGWLYVEVGSIIDSTTGSVEVRVDGKTVLTYSGNTQKTANAWMDNIYVRATNSGVSLDDFYYCDSTSDPGANPHNTFLGDCRVATLFTVGGAGTTQWSPSPNTNANWQNVEETSMDSDTTYNYTSTAGDEDLYNFQALPTGIPLIYGVQVVGAWRKDDAGARQGKQALRSGTTEVYGSTFSLPDTSYSYFSDIYILDPNTTADWTVSAVNALSAGPNLVA